MKKICRLYMILSVICVLLISQCMDGVYIVSDAATTTGTVTADNLNVRSGAGTNYSKVKQSGKSVQLNKNDKVTIISTKGDWYYVSFTYNKKTVKGYVLKQYVSTETVKKECKVSAKVREDNLYVRKSASTTAKNLTVSGTKVKLNKNKRITIRKEKTVSKKRWYYVSFTYDNKTKKGWVLGDYVRLTLSNTVKADISASKATVKKTAGNKAKNLKVNNKSVVLKKNHNVTIHKENKKNGIRYYYISFKYNKKTYKGYVKATEVLFRKSATVTNSNSNITATPTPTPPAATPTPTPTPQATPPAPLDDQQFEAVLSAEGFPDSYKPALRQLHASYPNWQFKALQTNLDWGTAVSKQAESTKNVITKNKADAWKSLLNYDYLSDKYYFPWSDNTWTVASTAAVSYYMDPRNFLNEKKIFMFESLNYLPESQTETAISAMVGGTPLTGSYSYTDANNNSVVKTYTGTFMEAAAYSGVSPYHLASRVKQEVITYKNGGYAFSNSVTGTVSGYEGYYNFFNIGAFDSAGTSAIKNGLNFAKTGGSMTAAQKSAYLIPWNNPYNSIMGGAKYLGASYINVGQNTLYLQKFNVSSYKTYTHQYMTNCEAVASEANSAYNAYYGNGTTTNTLNSTIVFTIPVFNNMPATPCGMPSTAAMNPNPYLSGVSVTSNLGGSIGTFKSGKNDIYQAGPITVQYVVSDPNVNAVTIAVSTVNANTAVNFGYAYGQAVESSGVTNGSGTYTHALAPGINTFSINTKAQNGRVMTYNIVIAKK